MLSFHINSVHGASEFRCDLCINVFFVGECTESSCYISSWSNCFVCLGECLALYKPVQMARAVNLCDYCICV